MCIRDRLEGARQVGKTYILRKFAKEYEHSIYINMLSLSGQEFLKCLSEASEWNPGEPRIDVYKRQALYRGYFVGWYQL